MDAIVALKEDHQAVEKLFKQFEKAHKEGRGDRKAIVDQVLMMLTQHAYIEETIFYPTAREAVPETEEHVLESVEEHHVVAWLLSELANLDPSHETYDAKMMVLIENVRHHVKEEEQDFFPKVRNELGRKGLSDLGDAMSAAKDVAPTHPHPWAPDVPPANAVAGGIAGVVDRVSDLVATILRRKSTSEGHKSATKVRARAEDATGAVIESVKAAKRASNATGRSAKRAATSTRKAAVARAKGGATSARKSAKKAVTSARKSAK